MTLAGGPAGVIFSPGIHFPHLSPATAAGSESLLIATVSNFCRISFTLGPHPPHPAGGGQSVSVGAKAGHSASLEAAVYLEIERIGNVFSFQLQSKTRVKICVKVCLLTGDRISALNVRPI